MQDINARHWFVYLVQTQAGHLYCGISNDPVKRFYKHCQGKGAKFFTISPATALVYIEVCTGKSEALRREKYIKTLSKDQKLALIIQVNSDFKLPVTYADVNDLKSIIDITKGT